MADLTADECVERDGQCIRLCVCGQCGRVVTHHDEACLKCGARLT